MRAWRLAGAALIMGAVVAVYHLALAVNPTTVAVTLLLAVLGISAFWGLAEALVASVVGVLGFNYFFLPPVGTFTVADPQNWVALAAFLVTAVTASQLGERARRRAAEAEARRRESEQLYELGQAMMPGGSPAHILRQFVNKAPQVLGCAGAAFYYRPAGETVRSGPETKAVSDSALASAAEWEDVKLNVEGAPAMAPVRFGGRSLGSLALVGASASADILRSIAHLAAINIEKARALEEASHAEAARQSEALKAALLDSLAHDIKTPLTSIKAAVTSLLGTADPAQHELLTIIDEEADRLNRLAAEVIEMARIEAGKLHLEKEPVEAAELIAEALAAFAAPLKERPLTVEIAPGLPQAYADREFMVQVVKHLVENALKYTPAGSGIRVSAQAKGGKIVMGVADRGAGIEDNERLRIFDKFYRGRRHRFEVQGTGMGLAIAKGIVEAHGERIWVESEPGQGSVFCFSLPTGGGR
jgi:two-component system, OmpR family, sensor histidine kinase KdpD